MRVDFCGHYRRFCSFRRSEIRCVSGATQVISPIARKISRPDCTGAVLAGNDEGRASVAGALTPIDMQDLTGDERCPFQEQDCVDNVPGFTHAPDWMQSR